MSPAHRSVHVGSRLPWMLVLLGLGSAPRVALAQDPPPASGSVAAGLSSAQSASEAAPPTSGTPDSPPPASATPAPNPQPAAPPTASAAPSSAHSLAAPSAQAAASVAASPTPQDGVAEPAPPERDTSPMAWASLAFRVGMAAVKSGEIANPAYRADVAAAAAELPPETLAANGYIGGGACTLLDEKCRTEGRFGVHLVAAIHLGGDGFGWDLEPYATFNSSSQAYGVYTGPKFDIHVVDALYLGFGFGLRAAYLQADGWLLGADLGGRVPLHAVWYVADNFALELDFGIGVGASGYMSRRIDITNPATGEVVANAPRMTFGLARAWDLSLGVRFP